ncbi:MAG: aminopeptidase P family protein [Planctomycetes bacterium]|nr:aminopeptidase P family protein [Planctomycetota bacterium]
MSVIPERLRALRGLTAEHGIDDFIVLSVDEHLNEYLPLHGARREFMSGFTGSAGDLLVGRSDAWLYTDGRYHMQAGLELEGSGFSLMKVGTPGSRSLIADIEERIKCGKSHVVGVDPMTVPFGFSEMLTERIERLGGKVVETPINLVDRVWRTRPKNANSRLIVVPPEWCGQSTAEKLAVVRADLAAAGADGMAVVKLDQIAWLMNLRAKGDIPYNPVFEAFMYLDAQTLHLFLRSPAERLPAGFDPKCGGFVVHAYEEFAPFLRTVKERVSIDPSGITLGVVSALQGAGALIVPMLSPIELRKSMKNPAEQDAQRRANLRASVAKTRTLLWLRRELDAKRLVTEDSARLAIEAYYAEQEGYFDLSFNTISATGAHGAIIHYGACDNTPLKDGDLYLIDSGAHIAGGTTDDTRTVAVGRCDSERRKVYTLVLKGHIQAARQTFPENTPGTALDALARAPLWNQHLNYDHGTGHGVGTFLNVHEGPFALSERERKSYATTPLKPGMVTSIEPGYYREGFGGVRLENLYLLRKTHDDALGRAWITLDPLTWIPFDPELVEDSLLDPAETEWLDNYHRGCIEILSPLLPETERFELRTMLR